MTSQWFTLSPPPTPTPHVTLYLFLLFPPLPTPPHRCQFSQKSLKRLSHDTSYLQYNRSGSNTENTSKTFFLPLPLWVLRLGTVVQGTCDVVLGRGNDGAFLPLLPVLGEWPEKKVDSGQKWKWIKMSMVKTVIQMRQKRWHLVARILNWYETKLRKKERKRELITIKDSSQKIIAILSRPRG